MTDRTNGSDWTYWCERIAWDKWRSVFLMSKFCALADKIVAVGATGPQGVSGCE